MIGQEGVIVDVPVELSRILITELGEQQVIFLKEINGERTFPIIIGITEALAIDRRLKGIQVPRPMTHDLLAGVIAAMGGKLEKVVINDLKEHTFFAMLHIRSGTKLIKVDARPSDAIALGIAEHTPIFVAEHVFAGAISEPTSRADRLELLRQRQNALADQINALTAVLAKEEFQTDNPPDVVQRYRKQLAEMQTEYDAIDEILKKLG